MHVPADVCARTICMLLVKMSNGWTEIGGSCVQVYKGILHGSTPVAIKFITRQTHKEKLRFVAEIHILKNLRHVNVSPPWLFFLI